MTRRPDQEARQQQRPNAKQANQPDAGQQSPIEYREVLERRNYDWTRPVAGDQTLAASNQLIMTLMVGMTGHVRSVAEKRDFVPNDYFLRGAYK